jgi:hypothetical protein
MHAPMSDTIASNCLLLIVAFIEIKKGKQGAGRWICPMSELSGGKNEAIRVATVRTQYE